MSRRSGPDSGDVWTTRGDARFAQSMLGGQAVIDGVMIRAGAMWAVAIRQNDGSISLTRDAPPRWALSVRRLPFVRGVIALASTVVLGLRATEASRRMSGAVGRRSQRSSDRFAALVATFTIAMVIVGGLLLPAVIANAVTEGPVTVPVVEGAVRLLFILAYLIGISQVPAIAEVLRYHGAEHQVIAAYEAGAPLDARSASVFSERHPRCGTDLLVLVAIISSVVYAFAGSGSVVRIALTRLLLLPVVAGVAFELLRLGGRGTTGWRRGLAWVGLAVQRITTREPDDGHREVAIAALQAALGDSAREATTSRTDDRHGDESHTSIG